MAKSLQHMVNKKSSNEQLNLAIRCHKSGNFTKAQEIYLDLLRQKKDSIKVSYLLGILSTQLCLPAQARDYLESYLRHQPDDSQALGVLGLVYFGLNDFEQAKKLFVDAISKGNSSATIHYNLGQTYFKLGQFEEACNAHMNSIAVEANNTQAYIGLGVSLRELKNFDQAKFSLLKACELDPAKPEAHFFYGNILRDLNDLQASVMAYIETLKLKPDYIEAAINCGNSYKDLDQTAEAIHFYDTALKLNPTHPEANYNKSLVMLSNSNFAEGWPFFEWRFKSEEAQHKFVRQPTLEHIATWDGQSLNGRLLVLPEQGIGDQIFFLGMLPDLMQRVQSLTVCIDSRLIPLLERTYPDVLFVSSTSEVRSTEFDAQIHLGSLGQFFRQNSDSFVSVSSPYLLADSTRSLSIQAKIKRDGHLICGVSWLSKNADHGKNKSLSLSSLQAALSLPGFDFIDLQYGDTQQERDQFHLDHGVEIIKQKNIDNFNDIDGLAALIAACDLVVTVSNTTAHLACALGKPTLVLLPQTSAMFWYWHREGMQTPWYPTAILLRQQALGGWSNVVQVVCQILQGMQVHATN
jgi:tetratricopeptide (TPR) repeat protein